MNNEIAVRSEQGITRTTPIVNAGFEDIQRIGNLLAASGYFSDVRDMAQAAVKVMAGQELGIPPVASMMGINIIKGKVALGAHLIASRIRAHGYDFRITKHDNKGCTIKFLGKKEMGVSGRESLGESSFDEEDAKTAGVFTDMYKKYPRNMYYSRALSNGAKWFTADVFGGAPIYTPEELGAEVDGEGDMVQPAGSQEAANTVRDAKLAEAGLPVPEVKESKRKKATEAPKVSFDLLKAFGLLKKNLGEERYYKILNAHGFKSSKDIPSRELAIPVYKALGSLWNDIQLGISDETVDAFVEGQFITPDQCDSLGDVWQEGDHRETMAQFLKAHGIASGFSRDVPVARLAELMAAMRRGDAAE